MTDLLAVNSASHRARAPSSAGPLAAADRLPFLDVLRGVAIVGALIAYTTWGLGSPPRETWSAFDRALDRLLEVLVDGKFLTTFSFLFGAGVAQQWRRLEAQGRDARDLHLRRMAFLLPVGLAHAVLLRHGDVLAPYAILGLALLAVRRWPTRRIIGAALALAVASYVVQVALHLLGRTFVNRPLGGLPDNSWIHYWTDNWAWLRYGYLTKPVLSWPRLLAVMLAGVAAERARFLTRLATDRRLAWRTLAIALPVAVVSRMGVSAVPRAWDPAHAALARSIVSNQLYWMAAWGLAAAYASALALLCQRPVWVERLAWLGDMGRMAFTNYLVQAAIVVPLCISLGLFDAVMPTRAVVLAGVVMAVQVPTSVWWLRRYGFGPVEWAWRAWTYRVRPARRV